MEAKSGRKRNGRESLTGREPCPTIIEIVGHGLREPLFAVFFMFFVQFFAFLFNFCSV